MPRAKKIFPRAVGSPVLLYTKSARWCVPTQLIGEIGFLILTLHRVAI